MSDPKSRPKKIVRMMKKSFGIEDFETYLLDHIEKMEGIIEDSSCKELMDNLKKFPHFLDQLDESNAQYALRIDVATRNVALSSNELNNANEKLSRLNASLNSLLESLEEGYLVFDKSGKASDLYTEACLEIFGESPMGKSFAELLGLSETSAKAIDQWIQLIFDKKFPFENIKDLGPNEFNNSAGSHYKIRYRLLSDQIGNPEGLVMILADKTDEKKMKIEAIEKAEKAERLIKMAHDRQEFFTLLNYFEGLISKIKSHQLEVSEFATLTRDVHTLKGVAAGFFLVNVVSALQDLESDLKNLQANGYDKTKLNQSVQAHGKAISQCIEQYGEEYNDAFGVMDKAEGYVEVGALQALDFLDQMKSSGVSESIRSDYIQTFFGVSIQKVFHRYKKTVDQACFKLGKDVEFIRNGDDFAIIPQRYEKLLASLVHVFRNSISHGIETPAERTSLGKPPKGIVQVNVEKDDDPEFFVLKIFDDGQGINVDRIREKLTEAKDKKHTDKMNDEQILDLIFQSNFSTANNINEISGMGVGLDSVKHEVESLGGQIQVKSEKGSFTEFVIRLPLINKNFDRNEIASSHTQKAS